MDKKKKMAVTFILLIVKCLGVEISYCDKDPLSFDLTIKLTRDGIKLVFDSLTQTLKIIEIYDLSLVRLKYW